jgi:hypothetical protein
MTRPREHASRNHQVAFGSSAGRIEAARQQGYAHRMRLGLPVLVSCAAGLRMLNFATGCEVR